METSVKDRLMLFIKSRGISVNKFEKICGFSTGFVANMRKSMQPDKAMSIVQNFPELNTAWLFTGMGEMINLENENVTEVLQNSSGAQNTFEDKDTIIALLKKDVKYYADIADSRLETIKVQSKLISQLEEQINANR